MSFFIFLFTFRAGALSADALFVQKLNRARKPSEIQKLKTEFEDLKVARRACRLQMQARVIPVACFEALKREESWGLAKNARSMRPKLDALCEEAARELRGSVASIDERAVSPACRVSLQAARRIEHYRSGDLVRDLN